jgi:hypothetical protein
MSYIEENAFHFFIIVLVGKVRNIIGITIESFGIKDVSPLN